MKLNQSQFFGFLCAFPVMYHGCPSEKGLPKTFRKVEFCCAIYKSLALIDFGSVFVSKVRPKFENLGSSGLAVKQA